MNLYTYLLASVQLKTIAVLERGAAITYAELIERADAIATVLAELAVGTDEPVAILARNSAFWIASYLAILKRGAIAVPLPQRLAPSAVGHMLVDARCRFVCAEPQLARKLLGQAPPGVTAVLERDDAGLELRAVTAPHTGSSPTVETAPDQTAAFMFTSGSTGRPNAVRVSHGNIIANTEAIISSIGLTASDSMMVVLPFDYCFGTSLLHTHLRVGGTLALNNTPQFAESILDDIDLHGCTGLAGVPTVYQYLLRRTSLKGRGLPSLRHAQQAGGRLAPALVKEFVTAVPNARFYRMYGQTEATARLTILPPEELWARGDSVGRAVPGVSLTIVGEDGRPLATGEVGEVVASGPSIASGYLLPSEQRNSFRDGRLYTGDLGSLDADGYLYLSGRDGDFIKASGHRIGCREIEDARLTLPGVVEAAAVAVSDDELGEAVRVYLVTDPAAELPRAAIIDHCRRTLPSHAIPREIFAIRSLPKNGAQKVLKHQLRPADCEAIL